MWLCLSPLCWPDGGLQLCGYVCLPCAGLIVVYSYVVMFVFPVLASCWSTVMWLCLSSMCWPDAGLQLCGYVCLPCGGLIVVYSYVVMFVFPVLA